MTDLTDLTIAEAGARLSSRAISSVELLEAGLRRIEQTEPLIHAYAHVMDESARRAAKEADRELQAGRYRGPLHGIPLAAKDLCYTLDAPTEAGSRARAGFQSTYDATVVTKLRDAGAVIVGKTVTHELAYGVNVPPTRNAWNPACYPGGSSAGSGAAVAARSAFGAIGTDTGGSIREPAALNGLVGLKPTYGLVSRHGIVPLSASLDHAGPLTRTVEDCALLLQAIAGYDPRDAGSFEIEIPDYASRLEPDVRGLTVGVERSFFDHRTRADVHTAVGDAIEDLREQGVRIIDVTIPEMDLAVTIGMTILLPDASASHAALLRERGADLDPATRVMLEIGELVPARHYVTAQQARRFFRDAVRRVFEAQELDALLTPTLPSTTLPIDAVTTPDETGEAPLDAAIGYSFPANITGQPALTVPCGFSSENLPIGFQLLGRPFDEPTLFRLARAYERNHDWAGMKPPL